MPIPSTGPFSVIIGTLKDNPLYLNFKSQFNKINVRCKTFDQSWIETLTLDDQTLQNFDFKLENSNDGTITYKPKDFIDFEYPMILFYFTPENIENNIGS